MKKLLLSIVLLSVPACGMAGQNSAASIWNGPYAGFSAGYSTRNAETDFHYTSYDNLNDPFGFEDIFGPGGPLNVDNGTAVASAIERNFLPASIGDTSTDDFTFGVQAGYNYLAENILLGCEIDINLVGDDLVAGFNSEIDEDGISVTTEATQESSVDWLSTVRGRLGIAALDKMIVYTTGGLAYGSVSASMSGATIDNKAPNGIEDTSPYFGSYDEIRAGYTVGAGVEYAVADNISLKGEYLYYDLGTATYDLVPQNDTAAEQGLNASASHKFDGSLIRIGLNYHF